MIFPSAKTKNLTESTAMLNDDDVWFVTNSGRVILVSEIRKMLIKFLEKPDINVKPEEEEIL